jgi:hypothetical protein
MTQSPGGTRLGEKMKSELPLVNILNEGLCS